MVNIGIIGANGRMGRMLIKAVADNPATTLKAGIVRTGSSLVGVDAGELVNLDTLNVKLTDDLAQIIDDIDVVIDFSLPEATAQNIELCCKHGVNMVIGTTGLNDEQNSLIQKACDTIAIVYAGNYSTGVNVSLKLVEIVSKAFGDNADIEIIEAHHKHKIDAPSGTAFMMAQAVAHARNQDLKQVANYGREGKTGKRPQGEIGIHAVRGGEIVGEHTVMFIGDGEIVEITHKAQSRQTFATGAVRASVWVHTQKAGLYDMQDVLGLKDQK